MLGLLWLGLGKCRIIVVQLLQEVWVEFYKQHSAVALHMISTCSLDSTGPQQSLQTEVRWASQEQVFGNRRGHPLKVDMKPEPPPIKCWEDVVKY